MTESLVLPACATASRSEFFVFEGDDSAYNIMDAGNYRWGYAAGRMGHGSGATLGAQAYSLIANGGLDSSADLKAIKSGNKAGRNYSYSSKDRNTSVKPDFIQDGYPQIRNDRGRRNRT